MIILHPDISKPQPPLPEAATWGCCTHQLIIMHTVDSLCTVNHLFNIQRLINHLSTQTGRPTLHSLRPRTLRHTFTGARDGRMDVSSENCSFCPTRSAVPASAMSTDFSWSSYSTAIPCSVRSFKEARELSKGTDDLANIIYATLRMMGRCTRHRNSKQHRRTCTILLLYT